MDKKAKNTMIVSVIALALVLIGVTYAYFSARITGLESASTISLTAGRMVIQYSEGDENVIMTNIYPREEAWATKTFTLTGWNSTEQKMKYDVGLNVITNTFPDDYLTIDLKVLQNTNGKAVKEKTGFAINGTGTLKFGEGFFTQVMDGVHAYELNVFFKDNGEDQNDAQGAIFNAKIAIVEHTDLACVATAEDYPTLFDRIVTINSYDVNSSVCQDYFKDDYGQDNAVTICSKGVIGDPFSLDDDISNGNYKDYIEAGVIENVVLDGENVTSYSINYNNCYDYVYSQGNNVDEAETLCSGKSYLYNQFNLDSMIVRDLGEELLDAGVISNLDYDITYGDQMKTGAIYTYGDYEYRYNSFISSSFHGIYTYKSDPSMDGWSMKYVGNKGGDVDINSPICSTINGKPVKNMNYAYDRVSANSIDFGNFDAANIISMQSTFYSSNITNLDLSYLDLSSVENMSNMFSSSTNAVFKNMDFNDFTSLTNALGFFRSSINVDATGTNFRNYSFNDLFIPSYNNNCVNLILKDTTFENIQLDGLFAGSTQFNNLLLLDMRNASLPNATSMDGMFKDNIYIKDVNLSGIFIPNVTNLSYLFQHSNVQSVDLSKISMPRVTNLSNMFYNTSSITDLNLSGFDTSNVTDMKYMFANSNLSSFDLSSFNTSNVRYMSYMFASSKATNLDLSSFDTSSVTDMNGMFSSSRGLSTIYISNSFTTANVSSGVGIFLDCTSLVGGSGTVYDSNYVNLGYAHIDGGPSNPGYFTAK